ncbi:MAG: YggS family pyridoxal phosphate-dependent enzyme [Oligoflexia bacterium]|nr:YggS family pyridoxal phosphate-dependent enzyme [Oligoflexia bacterium]
MIKENIRKRLQEINNTLSLSSSDGYGYGDVRLIAVSKTFPTEYILAAYELGVRDFGESRVQELQQKSNYLIDRGITDINWHFIGHIQSNKLKTLLQIPYLKYIHSIDSLQLLNKLIDFRNIFSKNELLYFLQVNTSFENEKSGFTDYSQLLSASKLAASAAASESESTSALKWIGLMTMGPIRTDNFDLDTQKSFNLLLDYKHRLENDLQTPSLNLKLSMGMSQDYQLALKYQTNFVRIGSYLFGER